MKRLVALVLLACFVAPYLVTATPRSAPESPSTVQGRSGASHDARQGVVSLATLGSARFEQPPVHATAPRGAPLAARSATGWATWYDDGPGMYGAVPSWRWGDEPYTVQVCGFEGGRTNCVLVTVRDFCLCGDRHGVPTVIDLSPSAFRALAPLSRGVIRVTVDGVRSGPAPRAVPTAPATDLEGME